MRVVIPAAGMGTRLRPYTDEHPKSLVPINGKPLLWHTMERLAEAGVSEAWVVGGYRIGQLRDSLRRCPIAPPLQFVNNAEYSTTNSIVSLALTREVWDEPFCVIDGDVLVGHSLLRRLLGSSGDVLAVDTEKPHAAIDMKVEIRDGRVCDFGKELPLARSHGEFFGVSRWSPAGAARLSGAIDKLLDAGRSDVWYEFAIRDMAADHVLGLLTAQTTEWAEVDCEDDLRDAAALIERERTESSEQVRRAQAMER